MQDIISAREEQQTNKSPTMHCNNLIPTSFMHNLAEYSCPNQLAATSTEERNKQAIQYLKMQITQQGNKKTIDLPTLDKCILQIDEQIQRQLDALLHQAEWKKFESSWMSLDYLLQELPDESNIQIDVLDANKQQLQLDYKQALNNESTLLHRLIYQEEYDTPGGSPYAAVIMDEFINNTHDDMDWAEHLCKIGEQAHCPFIINVAADFFKQNNAQDLLDIHPLATLLEQSDYLRFNSLRQQSHARYINFCLPQFLLRLPYGDSNKCRCNYQESLYEEDNPGCWGKASVALATCMLRSFHKHGWAVNIQGPQSGGLIENLHTHHFDHGYGWEILIPMEMIIPENLEIQLAHAGFIPLSYYKHSQQACFFSVHSIQKPIIYEQETATANSRINSKLPYVMLTARLAHYLKVIQRENIGSYKDAVTLEQELNQWLQKYVTRMNHPNSATIAKHPLKSAAVQVETVADRPGYYRVSLQVCPHWHMEGMDIALSCVSWLPQSGS